MITHHLTLTQDVRRRLSRRRRTLRHAREAADYCAGMAVNRAMLIHA